MKKHTDPIDWSFWQHMPALLWQACALSLNINPDNIKHHLQRWMNGPGRAPIFTEDSFPSEAVKTTFDRRLRLLGEHYQSPIFTDIDNSNAGGPHFAKVTIQNFAKWGLDVNFKDMPTELIAMAQQHNKGKVRDDGLVRLDALLLEISTELITKNPAVPQKSLKASLAAASLAHAGLPLEHVQAMTERGEITLRDVFSRIPPPLPPKIEHIADWLLSTPDAGKVRAKLRALSAVDELSTVAPADSKPQSQTPAELRKNHESKRERGCRRLILEHWDDIKKLHGPNANGRQARHYILKKIDASESKPALKTVQNKLAELRSEKRIP